MKRVVRRRLSQQESCLLIAQVLLHLREAPWLSDCPGDERDRPRERPMTLSNQGRPGIPQRTDTEPSEEVTAQQLRQRARALREQAETLLR